MACNVGFRRTNGRCLVLALVASLVGPSSVAHGDVKVPAIFGPHMVLQRDQKDRVWGWAEPGEEITVTIGEQEQGQQGRHPTARGR